MSTVLNTYNSIEFNELQTDFRAEVLAVSLMDSGYVAEDILIKRAGSSNRARNKDVSVLKRDYFDSNINRLVIETNREGIYDYMPEGVFHPPTLGGRGKSNDEIIEEIRKQRVAEEHARRFFTPFELETSYVELAALYYENCFDKKASHDELLDVLEELWPILKELDKDSAKVFIYMLPFFHAARGNKLWFQKYMTSFLGYTVTVNDVYTKVEEAANLTDLLLGNSSLGINSILCGDHFDGNVNWQVNIGPVPAEDVARFIEGSEFNRLLNSIYNYCLPVYTAVVQQCITVKNESSFTISTAVNHQNYLGYTTFL